MENYESTVLHVGVVMLTIPVECYALLASESAHAKLEAHTTLRYVQTVRVTYRKIAHSDH